ncbi:MAG: LacI family DNA-binding transcriptional regulator [Phycisphaeraceae bacterium]
MSLNEFNGDRQVRVSSSTTSSNVTVQQIAERLGVSLATVSLALNHPDARVAAATRSKVLRTALEMGYHRSTLARAIKIPLRHVGVVLGDTEAQQPLANQVLGGILAAASAENYLPLIQPSPRGADQTIHDEALKRIVDLYASKLVDGFILDKRYFLNASILRMHSHGVPVVTVNGHTVRTPNGKALPSVMVDTREGGRLATAHLLELGHRRVGLISPPYSSLSTDQLPWWVTMMIVGYRKALRRAGVPMDPRLLAEGDPENKHRTYAAITRLMNDPNPPTALLVGDDRMAVMAIHALALMGLRVPGDVSVVGFGDLPVARNLSLPELTSVHVPLRESGQEALRMLVAQLDHEDLPSSRLVLQPRLVIRQSTQPKRLS